MKNELEELLPKLKKIALSIQAMNESIAMSDLDIETRSELNYLLSMATPIEQVISEVEYWNKPIKRQGTLNKNSLGRYEIGDGDNLTSGSTIEVLKYDSFYEYDLWIKTTIEHNEDYYAIAFPGMPLNGFEARVR
ncbi:DUF5348 domain-containing protein [Paenibacillus phytorum]|uniref:DUF5348 domain-containing protein n=1 Tax=Paenibacillus phytorum TaxID=2654977 RepID=UPI0014910807|nr:DUF5348 domain-containing protein [Paenibacillus phytorum]